MAEFYVDIGVLKEREEELKKLADELKEIAGVVSAIRLSLDVKILFRENICRELSGLVDQLLEQAEAVTSLKDGLAYIGKCYADAEKTICSGTLAGVKEKQPEEESQNQELEDAVCQLRAYLEANKEEIKGKNEAWKNEEEFWRFVDHQENNLRLSYEYEEIRAEFYRGLTEEEVLQMVLQMVRFPDYDLKFLTSSALEGVEIDVRKEILEELKESGGVLSEKWEAMQLHMGVELAYKGSALGVSFEEMELEWSAKATEERNKLLEYMKVQAGANVSNRVNNPPPTYKNLDPNIPIEAAELEGLNRMGNYDYIPMSPESLALVKRNEELGLYGRNVGGSPPAGMMGSGEYLAAAGILGQGVAVAGSMPKVGAEGVGGANTPVQEIQSKFPLDNQTGKTFNYTIENGKLRLENGIEQADFVVDMNGNLQIGRGHSYLANGEAVEAAGTVQVNSQGYVRLITNESGHYQPTIVQAQNYVTVFENLGLKVENSWIRIGSFDASLSNYVINKEIFYNGPIKYMPE